MIITKDRKNCKKRRIKSAFFIVFWCIFALFAQNMCKEGNMKDVMMLLGFSMGLVTGALLYKYSQSAKQFVDKGEKK